MLSAAASRPFLTTAPSVVPDWLPGPLAETWRMLDTYPILQALIVVVAAFVAAKIVEAIVCRGLTRLTRRDRDVITVWTVEHYLKSADDLRAWLERPAAALSGEPDPSPIEEAERAIGDSGIVMIDAADPLCVVADLFDMATFTIVAATEPALMHAALERVYKEVCRDIESDPEPAIDGRGMRSEAR